MAIKTNYGSVTDWLSNKKYTPLVTPDDIKNGRTAELQGLGVGDLYGIEYDAGAIEGVYNRATDAQYALKQKEYQAAENQYYRNMYASQNSAIDALRAQRADQIATGMSAGLAAAAESATAMGLQDTNAAGALELANQRQMMADEIAAAYAENIVKAFETSQSAKQAIAGLDLDKFKADTEWDAALAGTLGYLEEANANVYASQLGEYATIVGELISAQAQRDAASINASGGLGTDPNSPEILGTEAWLEQFTDPTTGYHDIDKYRNDAALQKVDPDTIAATAEKWEKENQELAKKSFDEAARKNKELQQVYKVIEKKIKSGELPVDSLTQLAPLLNASSTNWKDINSSKQRVNLLEYLSNYAFDGLYD